MSINNLPKVSVGIAAYNEANKIKGVLEAILSQTEDFWTLIEVTLICDGCTDKTAEIARSLNNAKIKIVEHDSRKGKTSRLNEILTRSKGDVLVLFDADINITKSSVISQLVRPIFEDQNIVLTGGNSRPIKPTTFFQKAVYSTFNVFYKSRLSLHKGDNIYGCTGSIMALRGDFAKTVNIPNIVNEDAYIYMLAKSQGFSFRYVDGAIIEYGLPTNMGDYTKQILRSEPVSVNYELEKYFDKSTLKELNRPFIFYFSSVIIELFKNPIGVILIIMLNSLARPFMKLSMSHYNLNWFSAKSTK